VHFQAGIIGGWIEIANTITGQSQTGPWDSQEQTSPPLHLAGEVQAGDDWVRCRNCPSDASYTTGRQ
jgi:hypothetical protein